MWYIHTLERYSALKEHPDPSYLLKNMPSDIHQTQTNRLLYNCTCIKYLALCMARPLAMAILLLFVHPLLDLVLLHLHPAHRTDLPSYLPQTAARDCSSWGGEGRVPLLVSLVANEPIRCDSPITGNPQTHPQQDCCRVLSTDICLPQPVGWCRSRTLLQRYKVPYPLNC